MSALMTEGWCEVLPTQLDLSVSDKDGTEKILTAIEASASSCRDSFVSNNLEGILVIIKKQYEEEIAKEDDVDFKSYLSTFPPQIDEILRKLEMGLSVLI